MVRVPPKKNQPDARLAQKSCDLGSEEDHCNSDRWCVKFSTIGMP